MFTTRKVDRLGQWDGRKHSSRHEEPFYKRLAQPDVLLRLAVVAATVLIVTALPLYLGAPIPYKEGHVYDHDVKARVEFDYTDPPSPLVEHFAKGSILVPQRTAITDRQFDLLRHERRTYLAELSAGAVIARGSARFLIFLLLAGSVVLYTARFQASLAQSLAMIAGMMPMALGLGEGGEQAAPLGRAVVGGLFAATGATLLLLPAVFAVVQCRARLGSVSLHPFDPTSRHHASTQPSEEAV